MSDEKKIIHEFGIESVCACGHSGHWHGAFEDADGVLHQGAGRCDDCSCLRVVWATTDTIPGLRAEVVALKQRIADLEGATR